MLPVQRVCCCNCRFSNQSPALVFHIVLYPHHQLAIHVLQLQSRIWPTRSSNIELGDCFSRFVLSFLTTPQIGPLGSEFSGTTEIHYYLQPLLDKLARNSDCNLIQLSMSLITEGSQWPIYNLIIKSAIQMERSAIHQPFC